MHTTSICMHVYVCMNVCMYMCMYVYIYNAFFFCLLLLFDYFVNMPSALEVKSYRVGLNTICGIFLKATK